MEHQESEVKVFKTTEYSRFRMISGNRDINEAKVKRIMKEIGSGNDMLRYKPVEVKVVQEKLDILDGQHRFHISRLLKKPVYYIIVEEEKSMPDIAKVNSNVEKWKSKDFINCYVTQGNHHYRELQGFIDDYHITASLATKLLYYGNPGSDGGIGRERTMFEDGSFVIRYKSEAYRLLEICQRFKAFPHWRDRAFVSAIYRIDKAKKIDLDVVVISFNKRPEMLKKQSNYKEYIYALEGIINVGKQSRVVIV